MLSVIIIPRSRDFDHHVAPSRSYSLDEWFLEDLSVEFREK